MKKIPSFYYNTLLCCVFMSLFFFACKQFSHPLSHGMEGNTTADDTTLRDDAYFIGNITIQLPHGEELPMAIFQGDTILAIKQRIEDQTGTSALQQELHLDGNKLENHNLVSLYEITAGAILKQILCSRGFNFSNMASLETRQDSSDAPVWRHYRHGLSVVGKCRTPGCKANGKQVISPQDFIFTDPIRGESSARFDMGILTGNAFCPMCKNKEEKVVLQDVQDCIFSNCRYSFRGKKQGAVAETTGEGIQDQAGCCTYFGSSGGNLSEWHYLFITVSRLD